MSLDTVELAMKIEEEFEIAIPNEIAPTLFTVGDLHEFVVQTVAARGAPADDAQLWERLKRIFVDDFLIPEKAVVRNAHIVYDLGLD